MSDRESDGFLDILRPDRFVPVNVADEDHNDCPPYNLKDVNWPVPDEVEDDTRAGNCTPSDDIIARMRRDSKESGAFAFITLARAHIGGLAFSEYGFPGYERREKLLARAIARTSTFLGGAKRELCDDGGEVTARTKELASFGDQRSPLVTNRVVIRLSSPSMRDTAVLSMPLRVYCASTTG